MEYKDIYLKLKQHDNSLTEERFCVDYLNRSSHYLSMCKSTDRDISSEAKLNLWLNLEYIGKTWTDIAESAEPGVLTRACYNAGVFNALAGDVKNHIIGLNVGTTPDL